MPGADSDRTVSMYYSIGFSSTQLVIYFNDSENDLLLQSAGFFIDRAGEDRIRAIILAWLVMNYSRLSVAQTLMACLPWLFRTRSWVPWNKSNSCRII